MYAAVSPLTPLPMTAIRRLVWVVSGRMLISRLVRPVTAIGLVTWVTFSYRPEPG